MAYPLTVRRTAVGASSACTTAYSAPFDRVVASGCSGRHEEADTNICMSEQHSAKKPSLRNVPDGAAIARLAQILTHRLGGLLASIEGYTVLLAETLTSDEQHELAEKILEGAARIERILADLQLYGRPSEAALLPVRVIEITRDLIAPLPESDARRIRLCLDERTSDHILQADPFLIRQALLILIQNALDASDVDREVTLTSRREDAHICFDIRNEGTIDGREHDLFEPFYTTKAQNLGVGLPVARHIARLHSGRLELTTNSREDGTCFTLAIPESA